MWRSSGAGRARVWSLITPVRSTERDRWGARPAPSPRSPSKAAAAATPGSIAALCHRPPVQADGARASVVGQGLPDAQGVTLCRELGNACPLACRALLDF